MDRFINFEPQVTSDVIPVVVDPASMYIRVKFGDSRSNCSRDTRLPHFVTDERHRRTKVITFESKCE